MIYEPRGKAREYSPLAVNLFSGCGHKCSYCYVPDVIFKSRNDFDNNVSERKNAIKELYKSAKKFRGINKQVLMSFTTDPYNPLNDETKLTASALEILFNNQIPVAILTKSGLRALQDLELFKKFEGNIKVGASLTYDNEKHSRLVESGAALPNERIEMLKTLNKNNVRTWVSFEPIVQPYQTLNLLEKTVDFVDEYQLGKLAHDKRKFDWNYYLQTAVDILRKNKKEFYIKKTLREAAPNVILTNNEKDMDYLTVKWNS